MIGGGESYLHSPFFEISKSLKNPSATGEAYCRDLTSLCLRLCIGVKLRAASGPAIAYCVTRAPPLYTVCHSNARAAYHPTDT